MSRAIIPIASLARRVPEAGRIRTGKKVPTAKGKERPVALPEFRFTSHDKVAIEQIATLYGGDVLDWQDPKAAAGQFEVHTTAPAIRVILPPDPLGGTPIYESWGGGGCDRRCDGVDCTTQQIGPDGPEPVEVPCLCLAKGVMVCKPTTRLSVILPEVRFAGVWRLDTKSWNAAQELPGMVDMIHAVQDEGLQYATLTLKPRLSRAAGQTRTFLVPTLGLDVTVEELTSGAARLSALPASVDGAATAPALGAGRRDRLDIDDDGPYPPDPDVGLVGDDDVIDAEIVDDDPPSGPQDAQARRKVIAATVASLGSSDVLRALQEANQPTTGNAATRAARLAAWRMHDAGIADEAMIQATGLVVS